MANAAAPVIRTERLVSEFMFSPSRFRAAPRNAHLHLVTSHHVAARYGSEHRHLPLAFLAGDRTACMEHAAARRGQGRGYFAAECTGGTRAFDLGIGDRRGVEQ